MFNIKCTNVYKLTASQMYPRGGLFYEEELNVTTFFEYIRGYMFLLATN